MMSQENYVNINDLHTQGWTINEIAEATGWHATTVSKYLKNGPPPATRSTEPSVMTEQWQARIETMLESWPRMLSVSVHNKLTATGFAGSYPTVVRAVRDIRGPRFRAADAVSVPIDTDPGEEAQFDFCDLASWAAGSAGTCQPGVFRDDLVVVAVADVVVHHAEDRHHTFEGIARFFDQIGGVPTACRTDRMGALGRSQGRRFELHPPTVGFAAHHAHEDRVVSGRRRETQRQGRASVPSAARDVPARGRIRRHPGRSR